MPDQSRQPDTRRMEVLSVTTGGCRTIMMSSFLSLPRQPVMQTNRSSIGRCCWQSNMRSIDIWLYRQVDRKIVKWDVDDPFNYTFVGGANT